MSDAVHQTWIDSGFIELPDFLDSQTWDSIEAEAHSLEPDAFDRLNENEQFDDRRDGSLVSPQRCRAHLAGPALREIAISREFNRLVSAATGLRGLVPARLGYKYYTHGDFMAVHRDDVKCAVTVSFGVTSNLDYMGWMPSLRGESNATVIEHARREGYFPASGQRFDILHRKMRGFDGYNIPHWRPPFDRQLGILGFVCFVDLN
ncbi:hypothetical protein HLB23_02455 [Nocardia uniformis]|uniref:Uncharacterized protein n=1 Tax=Nocardia uniformis TaxID=53432 RepID=A0A849BWS5_9NOCA|nr:hypothetical protein [Nocardia uniformis]NNH68750.1 hypothetical protein [Nocardia uniformis]